MNKPVRTVLLIVSCMLALLVSGCLQTKELYKCNKFTAEKIALGKDSLNVGIWETFDIKIAYEFIATGDLLEISGQAELGDHQKMVYDHVRFLDIFLFFLDNDSRVLMTEYLDRSMSGGTEQTVVFKHTYKLPDGVKGLSFGYSGKVLEQDGQMVFYRLPLKK
jgi:hypothetical protein